jgi:hypothetical protein
VDYIRYIVERTTADPDLTVALFELRLESRRRPTLADVLATTLRSAYREDVVFNTTQGLPGGAEEIALLHYAIDGLLLDCLTIPIDPELDRDRMTDILVRRLVGPSIERGGQRSGPGPVGGD